MLDFLGLTFWGQFMDAWIFFQCTALETASMPHITNLGNQAFSQCQNLTSVYLPEATSIGIGSFGVCKALTDIDLPNVITFNSSAFGYSGLININAPKVTSVGASAFNHCTNLKSISLPNITTLAEKTFDGSTSLTNVYIPKVTTIGTLAFNGCTALKGVDMPSATSVSTDAFSGCTDVSVYISQGNALESVENIIRKYIVSDASVKLSNTSNIKYNNVFSVVVDASKFGGERVEEDGETNPDNPKYLEGVNLITNDTTENALQYYYVADDNDNSVVFDVTVSPADTENAVATSAYANTDYKTVRAEIVAYDWEWVDDPDYVPEVSEDDNEESTEDGDGSEEVEIPKILQRSETPIYYVTNAVTVSA
jgi:hypothetical protein